MTIRDVEHWISRGVAEAGGGESRVCYIMGCLREDGESLCYRLKIVPKIQGTHRIKNHRGLYLVRPSRLTILLYMFLAFQTGILRNTLFENPSQAYLAKSG